MRDEKAFTFEPTRWLRHCVEGEGKTRGKTRIQDVHEKIFREARESANSKAT
jgi:hypothetical protein